MYLLQKYSLDDFSNRDFETLRRGSNVLSMAALAVRVCFMLPLLTRKSNNPRLYSQFLVLVLDPRGHLGGSPHQETLVDLLVRVVPVVAVAVEQAFEVLCARREIVIRAQLYLHLLSGFSQ